MQHTLRPGSGTRTRRVWEIADELSVQGQSRAKREAVVRKYVAEGGNEGTANTQYQQWKKEYDETHRPSSANPMRLKLQVRDGGRIILPADLRAALGVTEGDELLGEFADGELLLYSRDTAVKKAQALVRKYGPEGVSLVDELIAERRAEARREAAGE